MGKLLDELKRRNVIRVAIAYVVASWLLLQVADVVLNHIPAPDWVMQVFMLVLSLCFPLVLAFAWAFELTPGGLKREKDVARDESITRYTARRLDWITIVLLALLLVIVGAERMFPAAPTAAAPTAANDVKAKSIAVLAFEDLSPEGDQAYFAEGISEELLNVLAQIPDLKVAGRTSSFAFKDQRRDLREIGEILEVAHLLEGSVRKSGNRVRVTAQLVKADDGFHLFSKNYDRELNDIFEVQDDIAREISSALRSAIFGTETIEQATPTAPEAYSDYLQARQWIHTRNKALMAQASELLTHALAVDPGYAPAYAQQAIAIQLLSNAPGSYGDIPAAEALRTTRPLIDKALELDPKLAEAHAALGLWYATSETTRDEAIASLRRALVINPNLTDASNWLAAMLTGPDAENERRALFETMFERDPLYFPAFNNLASNYMYTRELDKADALIRRAERIGGETPGVRATRGLLALVTGQLASAVEEFRKAYDFNPSSSVVREWYGHATRFIGDYETASAVSYVSDRLVALELADRHEEAVALLESLGGRQLDSSDLLAIGDWYLLQERPADLVRFIEDRFKDQEDWIAAQTTPSLLVGAAHFTGLAFALRQLGRDEEASRLIDRAGEVLEIQARSNADNFHFWLSYAEFAALSGDTESMFACLERAVDRGYIAASGFHSPVLDRYRNDRRFIGLENHMIRRVNEERRKLGMLALRE